MNNDYTYVRSEHHGGDRLAKRIRDAFPGMDFLVRSRGTETTITTSALTAAQKRKLDEILESDEEDSGAHKYKALLIGDYLPTPIDVWEPPRTIDYARALRLRLQRKETFVKGELRMLEFFAQAEEQDNGSWSYPGIPVVRERFEYERNAAGFAKKRIQTIAWIRKDGTEHPETKIRVKTYNRVASIQEGKRRRRNVVDDMELAVAGLLLETELVNNGGDIQATLELGRLLARAYGDPLRDFVNVSSDEVLTALAADTTYPWLENKPASLGGQVTIRQAVMASLDIWSE